MSNNFSGSHTLRNRKLQTNLDGPPVPTKLDTKPSLFQRRGLQLPDPPRQLKPLPAVPLPDSVEYKPLPRPPESIKLGTTLLWIAGFAVWFMVVVVMLPVIMEREAMIGVNAWLRGKWRDDGEAACAIC
ncbi:hypothetical protein BU25DRAFT_68591 [Macroventuria anomochaeta]|uniref:Uncharacterized protein n=1 Tax=Macroventuria anomochaeta TaxID=301207 RepID=A0ACB6RYG9_9PLEO|nr:uncharacterized protein BU25DRAFT_68591 [Macroventuria anomochaeta]KAF2627080.1 hypothetical protein BU25DRAFT_68591 [Macroventuria anomochaeta]